MSGKCSTNHLLRADLPPLLNVPEPERARRRCDRLREPKVGVLQERERELVILADRHQCAGGVQALSEYSVSTCTDEVERFLM